MKDGDGNPLLDMRKLELIIASKAIQTANEIPETMSTLLEQTLAAKQSLSATEIAAMLKPLGDIRKFFLGSEHDKEIKQK